MTTHECQSTEHHTLETLREKKMTAPTNSKSENAIATNNNILNAAQDDAGLGKILKFKKGEYVIGDDKRDRTPEPAPARNACCL
jgi:hypothetical protein